MSVSRCAFCDATLRGKKLAFDPARGRLWDVCSGCGQWNMSALETDERPSHPYVECRHWRRYSVSRPGGSRPPDRKRSPQGDSSTPSRTNGSGNIRGVTPVTGKGVAGRTREVPVLVELLRVRVAVPAGEHNVDLVYAPDALKYGALISGLSLLGIILLSVWAWKAASLGPKPSGQACPSCWTAPDRSLWPTVRSRVLWSSRTGN